MRNTIIASVVLVISLNISAQKGASITTGNDLLAFEHYPAIANFRGTPAKPQLITRKERSFRTEIREQVSTGPNFGGHFTIAKWGCGSPCLAFVIVNSKTGDVYDPGFPRACADGNVMDANIDFKLTSRLIIATGLSKETGACGKDFYEWDGKRFHLLHFEPWHPSD